MQDDHKTVTIDSEYDVTFHPAFASSCVVERKGGAKKTLYEQEQDKPVDCSNGHPTKHTIKLKGKGNKRDVTITIDDPNHSIAGLTLQLYDEARDPAVVGDWEATESFTVMNSAKTCPPHCTEE